MAFVYHVLLIIFSLSYVSLNFQNLDLNSVKGDNYVYEYPDEPIQIVKPDTEHKRLMIIEENVKYLRQIKGPVATVSVVGKFHSGKSFLLNQLMGKSNGFGVGPSVMPKTMGIWMWGKPVKYTLKSGLIVSIVFLDTEGFAANNVSENYDAKIFAVSTLLSSHLIYNSVKIIDQSDIDYLELLARRTQLFALRSQMSRAKWTNEFNRDLLSFPPLIWVVQDFVQNTINGETPKEWLHRLMDSHTRENDLYEISLKDIFKSIDCHTMFLPAVRKHLLTDLSLAKESELTDDYKNERDELIVKLKSDIIPKEKNDKPITGAELTALLNVLVGAANEGSLADIPNRWDAFVGRLQKTATEDCVKFYEADMNVLLIDEFNNEPVNMKRFDEWHNQSSVRSNELLEHLLHGLDEALVKGLHDLRYNIRIMHDRNKDINEKKIKLKCSQLQHEFAIRAEESLRKIELPILSADLIRRAKDIKNMLTDEFTKKIGDLIEAQLIESHLEMLIKSIKNQASSVQIENNKAIEIFMESKLQECMEKFMAITQSNYSRLKPRKPILLKKMIDEGMSQSTELYIEKCGKFQSEKLFASQMALLKDKLHSKANELVKENEDIATNYIKSQSSQLIDNFRERTGASFISLPINSTDLEGRLKLEIEKILRDYNDILMDYNIYSVFEENLVLFKQTIGDICDQRRSENVKAFAKEVEIPLHTSKKIILLSAEKYSTVFSLKQFMRSVCILSLNEGKPKFWSVKLKSDIIEQFINDDNELRKTIDSKSGIWSAIVGFLQWILWILNLG